MFYRRLLKREVSEVNLITSRVNEIKIFINNKGALLEKQKSFVKLDPIKEDIPRALKILIIE